MSENKVNPRAILAGKMLTNFCELMDLVNKYVPKKHTDRFMELFWYYVNNSEYLHVKTDEEIMHDYLMETVYYPKCPICVTQEQIISGEAGKKRLTEPCPYTDCPEHGPNCWGVTGVEPLFMDLGPTPEALAEAHRGWSDFHKWLWEKKEPTPLLENAEAEKAFYEQLEAEYRARGEYP